MVDTQEQTKGRGKSRDVIAAMEQRLSKVETHVGLMKDRLETLDDEQQGFDQGIKELYWKNEEMGVTWDDKMEKLKEKLLGELAGLKSSQIGLESKVATIGKDHEERLWKLEREMIGFQRTTAQFLENLKGDMDAYEEELAIIKKAVANGATPSYAFQAPRVDVPKPKEYDGKREAIF
ncbi:hypothetical protein ACET3Z_010745 [Daucus carota]